MSSLCARETDASVASDPSWLWSRWLRISFTRSWMTASTPDAVIVPALVV